MEIFAVDCRPNCYLDVLDCRYLIMQLLLLLLYFFRCCTHNENAGKLPATRGQIANHVFTDTHTNTLAHIHTLSFSHKQWQNSLFLFWVFLL